MVVDTCICYECQGNLQLVLITILFRFFNKREEWQCKNLIKIQSDRAGSTLSYKLRASKRFVAVIMILFSSSSLPRLSSLLFTLNGHFSMYRMPITFNERQAELLNINCVLASTQWDTNDVPYVWGRFITQININVFLHHYITITMSLLLGFQSLNLESKPPQYLNETTLT